MSEDFRFIIDKCPSQKILLLLRDKWEHYSRWLGPPIDSTGKVPRSELTEALSRLQVACWGGKKAPLYQTILPLKEMVPESSSLPPLSLLDVPEPEDLRWKYLSHFGVVVVYGPGPFIQWLRQLKTSGASVDQVSELYRHIQGYHVFHGDVIRCLYFFTPCLCFI
jgi:hypothetical protein